MGITSLREYDMATNHTNQVFRHVRRAVLGDGADLSDGQLLSSFIEQRDEDAFAALVKRHGPMVWGVCRRVLRGHQDAEDAFQASFLVLVRKAASIVPREMLGNWLYGVAFQTAVRARSMNTKRRARERQVEGIPEPAAIPEGIWSDLRPLLDRELSRLPDKYRVAVVLCDLEGKTYQQSAQQIGCPAGTFAARLARARTMLAKRLARYGLAMSGGMLATVLSEKAASAGVPTSALSSTIKAASLFAAGQAATTGTISVKVVALTEGVLKTMLLTKLKVVLVPLGVAALVGAAGLIYQTQAQPSRTVTATEEKENESRPVAKNPFRPQPEAAVKKELEKLQGIWIGVGGEFRGKGESEENSRRAGHRLVISDDKFAWKTALQEEPLMEGTVKINPTKRPKTMDMLFDREGKRAVGKCIYELDGETLKLCYGEPDRPSAFKTKPDSD